MKDKTIYVDRCRKFIDGVGYKRLAEDLNIVPQVVCNWKRRGIPQGWATYLNSFYKLEWEKAGLLDCVAR